jgi:DNA-binding Lrp family transcriptional regulator
MPRRKWQGRRTDEETRMLQAYILIQTEAGEATAVATAVADIDGVTSVSAVSRPHDVIAVTRTADVDELARLIMDEVQTVEGITRTLTCPVVRL